MMYKDHGRGSLKVDRVFAGIEIRKATGCPDTPGGRRRFQGILAMCEALADPRTGRVDLLRDLARGAVKLGTLYDQFKAGKLHDLPSGNALEDLATSWDAWVERSGGANRANRLHCLQALRFHLPDADGLQIADLPRLLRRLMDRYRTEGKARTANQYRAIVLAFCRDTIGKRHELRHQCADVPPMPYRAKRGHPVSYAEAVRIREALPAPYGAMWWALCVTGMRTRVEYLAGRFTVLDDRIIIHGTKTEASIDRPVPLIDVPVAPTRAYKQFRLHLARVAPGITLYDARRTYANWLAQAGIAKVRRDCYRGHSAQDMASLYEWHSVSQHLKADARRVRTKVMGRGVKRLRAVG